MTSENLTAILAERVMGWTPGPGRFLMGNRRWTPRWRFRPTENLDDAFNLLEKAAPKDYAMGDDGKGFWVRVRIGKSVGEARDASKARAISHAVARAIGLEPERCQLPKTGVERQ
ncbi:MAG: hypothetical protein NTY38_13085 [Acidobacteria bacterium]|nr:hypothetical protein [Acidobacteriota bacterium]